MTPAATLETTYVTPDGAHLCRDHAASAARSGVHVAYITWRDAPSRGCDACKATRPTGAASLAAVVMSDHALTVGGAW